MAGDNDLVLDVEPHEVWTGEYYRTYVVGNVSVAELDDHRIFHEEAEEIGADFLEKLEAHPQLDATVDIVDMDRAVGDLLLDTVERAAREGREHGLEKYAVVSEDVTKYAVKSKVDVEGVETFTSDDPREAFEWARE
jgi:kynurenine formamidase